MPKLFNAIPRHKKPSQSEFAESKIKVERYKGPNQIAKEQIKRYKKHKTEELRRELNKLLVSGVIFEDLKNEIREVLK